MAYPYRRRRRRTGQRGGAFPFLPLLSAVAPAVIGAVANKISERRKRRKRYKRRNHLNFYSVFMDYHTGLLRQRDFGGMDYHRGLLRQKGFGVGSLIKLGAPLVRIVLAPVIADFAGGLIRKKLSQRGRGFVRDALKSAMLNRALRTGAKHGIFITCNAAIDALDNKGSFVQGLRRHGTRTLRNVGGHVVEQQLRGRFPILNAPIIDPLVTKKVMPVIKRKVGGLIETNVNKVLGQRGKGMATDLLRMGVRQIPKLRRRKNRIKNKVAKAINTNVKKILAQRGRGIATDLARIGVKQGAKLMKYGAKSLIRSGVKNGIKKGAQD